MQDLLNMWKWPAPLPSTFMQLLETRGMKVTSLNNSRMIIDNRYVYYPHKVDPTFSDLIGFIDNPKPSVKVWTDGSGTKPDTPAGSGVVIDYGDGNLITHSISIGLGTNNRAELYAIYYGIIQILDLQCEIQVLSDSRYAIGSCTKPWNSIKNKELIDAIKEEIAIRKSVNFEHVYAHNGIYENELADKLANQGRKL